MTKRLEQGIAAVKALPPERQDMAGDLLLWIANQDRAEYALTAEQLKDLEIGLAQAERGEFASDEEVAAMWRKFGL